MSWCSTQRIRATTVFQKALKVAKRWVTRTQFPDALSTMPTSKRNRVRRFAPSCKATRLYLVRCLRWITTSSKDSLVSTITKIASREKLRPCFFSSFSKSWTRKRDDYSYALVERRSNQQRFSLTHFRTRCQGSSYDAWAAFACQIASALWSVVVVESSYCCWLL